MMQSGNNIRNWDKQSVYVWEAPDGGWGYMIVLSFIVLCSFTMSTYVAFGLVFGDFLKARGETTTATTLIHGVFGITFSLMGLLTNRLLSYYTLRSTGIVGSLIYFTGAFLSTFVQSIPQLIFTFGVLQGAGFGLMLPVIFTALNQYFVRERQLIHCIAQCGSTAVSLIFPIIIQYLVENYGQRGAAVLIAALSLHAVFAMVLIQPVEWHMVKKQLDGEESTNKIEPASSKISEENLQNKDNLPHSKKISFRQRIISTLDLTLLKDLKFVNLIFGCALGYVTDICLGNLSSLLLLNRGFSARTTAFILTLYVFGDFLSRIIQTIFNLIIKVKSRYLVLFGLLTAGILRFVFAFSDNLTVAAVAMVSLGFFRSWIQVPLAPAIAENCIQSRFPAAFGLYMIALCIFNVLLAIILAVTSQLYQNDALTVIILGVFILLGGLSWIYELVFLKYCRVKK